MVDLKIKQVKPVIVINYNINAANCSVGYLPYYYTIRILHCLHNLHNQSTAICQQIIRVDIEVKYFCDNAILFNLSLPDIRICFAL